MASPMREKLYVFTLKKFGKFHWKEGKMQCFCKLKNVKHANNKKIRLN